MILREQRACRDCGAEGLMITDPRYPGRPSNHELFRALFTDEEWNSEERLSPSTISWQTQQCEDCYPTSWKNVGQHFKNFLAEVVWAGECTPESLPKGLLESLPEDKRPK